MNTNHIPHLSSFAAGAGLTAILVLGAASSLSSLVALGLVSGTVCAAILAAMIRSQYTVAPRH